MKTMLSIKALLPLAAAVAGMSGAIGSTTDNTKGSAAPLQGYKHMSSQTACDISRECSDVGNVFCTDGGLRVWAKLNPSDAVCPIDLYEFPNP